MTRTSRGRWLVVLAAALAIAACRRDAEAPEGAGDKREVAIPPVPSTGAERVPAEPGRVVGQAALQMEGTVVSLDDESLVLRGGGEAQHELALDERTRFVGKDGERVGREAFEEGTLVQAQYANRADEMVAIEVRVAPAER